MQVHLFGVTSSPSCANFAVRKTAEDHKADFDEEIINNTVNKNFYVDDCLKSVPTISKAVNQLTALLAKGGFHLTKWLSNRCEVLASTPHEERASMVDIDFESLPVEKTMGMIWDVEADVFRIRSAKMKKVNTRQGILSLISSVYGPFGFGSPMMLPVKQALLEASITAVQLFTLILA